MNKVIPIFLACDNNYAPFLCTTMYSILLNTESDVEFYVMDGGISYHNKWLIRKSLKSFPHKKITYINMKKYDLTKFPNVKHYSLNTFSRYFIPQIFLDKEKVIYMDVDIIVKGDILQLYEQNLQGKPLGAVLEDFYEGNYTNLKQNIWPQYKAGDKYFNAGVLLMDISQFIKNNYAEKLIDLTIKLADKLQCPDQDVFNIVFENNFKILDYKYNYMPDHFHLLQQKHPEIKSITPLIIHYTAQKPWKDYSKKSADFDSILKKTAFAGVKNKRQTMKEKNIKIYSLFNLPLLSIEHKKISKKRLTIITICYNIEQEIEKTCKSIINQTWQDFEWIVVDGGSTDKTLDILKKYKKHIDVLISEADNGIYNAMNKCIKYANGEWINFMNGGDCYSSEAVLAQIFQNKIYDADILYGWQYFACAQKWRKYVPNLTKEWLCSNTLGHQATFFKRSCFAKYGLYDETFKIIADHERNICFFTHKLRFHYLPIEIAWFAEKGISSKPSNKPIFIEEFNRIYKKYYSPQEVLKYGRDYCK